VATKGLGRPPAGTSDARERLLDACWSLLTDPGRDDGSVAVAEVCGHADCTPPTLYHHFGDLAGLQRAACRRAFAVWAATLEREVDGSADPVERLRRRGAAYVAWGVAHPAAYRVLFMETLPAADPDDERSTGFDALVDDIAEATGLPADDPTLRPVALAHWSAVHGLTCLAIVHPALSEELRNATLDRLGTALRTLVSP